MDNTDIYIRIVELERRIKKMTRGYFILAGAIIIAFVLVIHTIDQVDSEASNTKQQAAHTKIVQKSGEPTGVCLREAMKAGLPIVVNFATILGKSEKKATPATLPVIKLFVNLTRKIEQPLSEYIKLQNKRYLGVVCPIK